MIPECRHIRLNGTKCCAAALRAKLWCYFHDNHHRERRARPALATTLDHGHIPVPVPEDQKSFLLDLPFLEDQSSIQLAIARVLQALAMNQLDPKRAGLLLYGLQIAARNLPEHELNTYGTVTNVAHTPGGIPYEATGLRIPTPPAIKQEIEDTEEEPAGDLEDDLADDLEDDLEDGPSDDCNEENSEDEIEDEDEREDEDEDEDEDITVSKPEYPQSLKDLQSFVARLRVAALHQGMDPSIVYGTRIRKPDPAQAPVR